jgi:hypothetical protein
MCRAGTHCTPVTARAKPFGGQPHRSVAATMVWEPSTDACVPDSAPMGPSWPCSHTRAIVYHLLTPRTPYRDLSAEAYEQRAREIAHVRQKVAKLGLTLVELHA